MGLNNNGLSRLRNSLASTTSVILSLDQRKAKVGGYRAVKRDAWELLVNSSRVPPFSSSTSLLVVWMLTTHTMLSNLLSHWPKRTSEPLYLPFTNLARILLLYSTG